MHIDRIEAMDEQGEFVTLFTEHRGLRPEVQAPVKNGDLMVAVQNIATDPDTLMSGEFLSKVMRLPAAWRNVVSEYINGNGAYQADRLLCTVRLRNVAQKGSSGTVQVVKQVHQRRKRIGNTNQDLWEDLAFRHNISPGEEIEMLADKAIHALWKNGRYAQDPHGWHGNGREGLLLEEVGYVVEYSDQDGTRHRIDSREHQMARMKEVLESAEELAEDSNQEALALMRTIPAHVDRPEDFAAFEALLVETIEAEVKEEADARAAVNAKAKAAADAVKAGAAKPRRQRKPRNDTPS